MSNELRLRKQRPAVFLVLTGLLLLAVAWAVSTGAVVIPLRELVPALAGKIRLLQPPEETVMQESVLWNLRIPRVLFAVLVGATLAVSGAILQGLFRNPLADPGLIGVSSGAAVGAVAVIMLANRWPFLNFLGAGVALPAAAFVGALVATAVIQRLATVDGYTSSSTLLLGGVAINALAGAVVGYCSFAASDAQLRSLTFWLLGSLGSAGWGVLAITAPICLLALGLAPRAARPLNALALGEAEAVHLGFHPEKVKRMMVFLVALGVGACVAFTGMIGFVGLVTPHLIRLLIGPDHRFLIPGSALLGGILMVLSDGLARILVIPAELPVGIVTAASGAPFFMWLLWRQRRRMLRL